MKAVIQRVENAACLVDGNVVGQIKRGFLVLLGVIKGDTEAQADALARKIAGLRVFSDAAGKMNLGLNEVDGGVLLISNFTLGADLSKSGKRPSFSDAASPQTAKPLYEHMAEKLLENGVKQVETGVFGAHMQIQITADGPVTLIAEAAQPEAQKGAENK